jgi:hypothetical protein
MTEETATTLTLLQFGASFSVILSEAKDLAAAIFCGRDASFSA